MLLVEIDINGATHYISNEMLQLTHAFLPWIESMSAPSWQMDAEHGGMCRFTAGDFTISPGFFKQIDVWPPPVQASVTAKSTASTEEAAVELFSLTVHLTSFNAEQVTYDTRDIEYTEKLLDETVDYDGNDVALPRASGTVTHVTPIRLADQVLTGYPTYHLGSIVSSDVAFRIVAFTYVSAGVTKIITDSAHGYGNGQTVYITGSANYDGGHVISAASGTSFTIPVDFAQETQPIHAQCYKAGHLACFDDGVPIPENVIINGDGTFSLTAYPVGQVTISGTGPQTTVDEVADWCATKLGIGTYTNTYARSPSPQVSRWETSQQTVVDFLSGLCQSFTHLFYIKGDELTLVDLYRSNGTRTLTEFNFFESVDYKKPNPLKKLIAAWQTYSAEVGFVNDDGSGGQSHFIKTNDHEVEEPLFPYGDEKSINVFHEIESNVQSALICIRAIYELDRATIPIPISGTLPVPGEQISWTDSTVPIDVPGYIRARDISYDFMSHEVQITGDGLFIRTDRNATVEEGTLSGAVTETLDAFPMDIGKGAVWRYVIDDGSRTNMRVGILQAVWDQAAGGSVEMMPDEHSPDIGTTLGVVTFTVDKAATTVRLRATSTAGSWVISVVRTIIGATY